MATSIDLAHGLLGAAENDELMARSLLPVEGVTDAGIGFHAQQAVEKAIKAVLAAKGTEFPFTHNLEHLRDFSEKSGIALPATLDGMEALTPFAAAERYGSEAPIGLDRYQALKWAVAAIVWAQGTVAQSAVGQEPPTNAGPGQTQAPSA
jgi:HEPN domain-containing protein